MEISKVKNATEPLINALTSDKEKKVQVNAAEALEISIFQKAIELHINALTTDI